jgi:hypothetical protein
MLERVFKERYYLPRESRAPLVLGVGWSFFSLIVMFVVARYSGVSEGVAVLLLILLLLLYLGGASLSIVYFSSRMVGPFERLNSEIDVILSGEYRRALHVRSGDDRSLRRLVFQINMIIQELEKCHRPGWNSPVQARFSRIISRLEEKGVPEDRINELLFSLNRKITAVIEEQGK